MSKPVKKLFDLEIDEVSVVDRAANQHSLIAFSKSAGGDIPLEGSMPDLAVYEETGEAVDVDTLEHGDVVYDEDGNEYVFVEDAVEDDDDGEDGDEVGKAGLGLLDAVAPRQVAFRGTGKMKNVGFKGARKLKNPLDYYAPDSGAGDIAFRGDRRTSMRDVKFKGEGRKANKGRIARDAGGAAAVTTAAGGSAYAVHRHNTHKSLGDTVLEQLSKAVTERDREEIIAKAMGEVEVAKAEAREALAYADSEREIRITQEFVSKAATYNLPVSPEVLGPILKAMAEVLDEDQLDVIDELFNSVGDALYNELGYVGESSNSSVIDAVDAYADDLVGKSDLTHAQATVALFEANPAAYDAYISEKGI
jgi:hypothetical protein